MGRESEKIPTSRVRRTATVATLAASEAVKQFGTRAANVARSEEASEEAMARRQLETAKQIVAALGTMKGAAMKLGQVMSFLDVGLVPEQYREEFQHELAKLRDAAPTVSFTAMAEPMQSSVSMKSPVILIWLIVSEVAPRFVTVIVCPSLTVPTARLANVRAFGFSDITGAGALLDVSKGICHIPRP